MYECVCVCFPICHGIGMIRVLKDILWELFIFYYVSSSNETLRLFDLVASAFIQCDIALSPVVSEPWQ